MLSAFSLVSVSLPVNKRKRIFAEIQLMAITYYPRYTTRHTSRLCAADACVWFKTLCACGDFCVCVHVVLGANRPDSLCFSLRTLVKTRSCVMHAGGCASACRVPLSWLSVFKQTEGPSLIYCHSRKHGTQSSLIGRRQKDEQEDLC